MKDSPYGDSSERADFDDEFESHDQTIQALYGIGLKLEYCIDLVNESPNDARAALDSAISGLGEVIIDIRRRFLTPRP